MGLLARESWNHEWLGRGEKIDVDVLGSIMSSGVDHG
jgi:hypothetical protein